MCLHRIRAFDTYNCETATAQDGIGVFRDNRIPRRDFVTNKGSFRPSESCLQLDRSHFVTYAFAFKLGFIAQLLQKGSKEY